MMELVRSIVTKTGVRLSHLLRAIIRADVPVETGDAKWERLLASEGSIDLLREMADKAIEEHRAGLTIDLPGGKPGSLS